MDGALVLTGNAQRSNAVVGLGVLLGIVAFHCQWFHIVSLEVPICSSLLNWWITPFLVTVATGAILGFKYPAHRVQAFVALLFPSLLVRQLSFFLMEGGPGNLWPLFLLADVILAGLVWLSFAATAKLALRNRA